jgi:hypothetical protein
MPSTALKHHRYFALRDRVGDERALQAVPNTPDRVAVAKGVGEGTTPVGRVATSGTKPLTSKRNLIFPAQPSA